MATGYYTLTAAADPEVTCLAFEAEANISAATAVGGLGESETAIVASEVLSAPNAIIFKVTGTATLDITNAATAVGGVEVARGYTAVS